MFKIVKNKGQSGIEELAKCKYLLYTDEFGEKELFAKLRFEPIYGYVLARIKGEFSNLNLKYNK